MTYLNINLKLEELTEAVLNSDMNTLMKSLAITVFNAYMEEERHQFIQAAPHERSDQRQDYRNGYYERQWTLSIGTLKLQVPRTRSGEFKTELFERYQRNEQAFLLSMMEMVINGVSTRKVTKIVHELCGETVSKSFVSDVMKRLDPEIEAFKNRTLTHSHFRYLYLDALYIKVREEGRVVSKAVYLAQGVNEANKREIIGFWVSEEESKEAWLTFLQSLRARGLRQPTLIISDAHAGLRAAIQHCFVGVPWQRCVFHFLSNIVETIPRKGSLEARAKLKAIFQAPTAEHARRLKEAFEASVADNPRYQKALKVLDEGFEDAVQFMMEPEIYHPNLRTTNSVERVNREIRRRDKVIGVYPNVASAERLIGAILIDLNDAWQANARPFLVNFTKRK